MAHLMNIVSWGGLGNNPRVSYTQLGDRESNPD